MEDIVIKTNGTVEGTSLVADGVDITQTCCCTSINMSVVGPYKSQFDGTRRPGYVMCSYEMCNESGILERKSIMSTEGGDEEGIGASSMEEDDSVGKPSRTIRYIGKQVDVETATLVDKIIAHCDAAKLNHPTREVLISRSLQSLKDKAEDLGIKLEDSTPPAPKAEESNTDEGK